MDILSLITGAIVALFVLDGVLLWLEKRGWIYWRRVKRKSSGGGIGAGLNAMNTMFDPSARHAIEARKEQEMVEDDNGDDDADRPPEDRLT